MEVNKIKILSGGVLNLNTLSNNTIFMCESQETKQSLCNIIDKSAIEKSIKSFLVGYDNDAWLDNYTCTRLLNFPQTSIYQIENLKLTVTVENAFVYTMNTLDDLWFVSKRPNGDFSIIPITDFENCNEVYQNINSIYKALSVGRFGIMGNYGR